MSWFSISIFGHRRTKSPMGMGTAAGQEVSIVSLFKETHNGQGKRIEITSASTFFFGELSFLLGTFFFFWSMVAQNASQHPEVVQNRGHGPGARASPALDPWTWLKQYS